MSTHARAVPRRCALDGGVHHEYTCLKGVGYAEGSVGDFDGRHHGGWLLLQCWSRKQTAPWTTDADACLALGALPELELARGEPEACLTSARCVVGRVRLAWPRCYHLLHGLGFALVSLVASNHLAAAAAGCLRARSLSRIALCVCGHRVLPAPISTSHMTARCVA